MSQDGWLAITTYIFSGVPSVLNGGSHHSVTLTPRQDTASAAPAAPGSIDLSQAQD